MRTAAPALAVLAAVACAGCWREPEVQPFVDATDGSGIDFVHHSGASAERHLIEILGAGGAFFDGDGDGDLDLLLRQGGPITGNGATGVAGGSAIDRLYRNDLSVDQAGARRPRFVDVTAGSGLDRPGDHGFGVATGDADGDGQVDLYLTNYGHNRLLRNLGGLRFEDTTAAAGLAPPPGAPREVSVAAAFFDFDRDGWLDLYTSTYVDFRPEDPRRCSAPSSRPDYCGPLSFRPGRGRLFHNLGSGRFEDASSRLGPTATGNVLGVAVADLDRNGFLDLFVASDALDNHLFLNQRGELLADEAALRGVAVDASGRRTGDMGVDLGDVDDDGDLDLVSTHIAGETHSLWLDDGAAHFRDASAPWGLDRATMAMTGFGALLVDADHDGLLDLAITNGAVRAIAELDAAGDSFPYRQHDQFFRNRGGRFEQVAVPALGGAHVGRGIIGGDCDNDGDLDLVLTRNGGPARLLLGTPPAGSRWLGFELLAGSPPRAPPGALLAVFLEGRVHPRVRLVRMAGSYAAAHDPRVLVGLRSSERVREIVVAWPSGRNERFAAPPANRYQRLIEGSGAAADPLASSP